MEMTQCTRPLTADPSALKTHSMHLDKVTHDRPAQGLLHTAVLHTKIS